MGAHQSFGSELFAEIVDQASPPPPPAVQRTGRAADTPRIDDAESGRGQLLGQRASNLGVAAVGEVIPLPRACMRVETAHRGRGRRAAERQVFHRCKNTARFETVVNTYEHRVEVGGEERKKETAES